MTDDVGDGRKSLPRHLYAYGVACLLVGVGITEILGSGHRPSRLSNADPVLMFVSEQNAMVLAAWAQLATGAFLFIPVRLRWRLVATLSLGLTFGGYQLTRLVTQVPEPCKCLSEVSKLLGLGKGQAAILLIAVIVALILPSALFLFAWNRHPQETSR
jgi:hypothetical protein